ncbi:MAG: hypothetical protein AAF939_19125 [Planctomycetota bacterium]
MDASNFHVYYGLRFDLIDADLTPFERQESAQQIAACKHGLDCWWGVTNEESNFLLLGTSIGNFGWEYLANNSTDDTKLTQIMADTKSKLVAAGYTDPPALHCQFEPDF